MSKREKITECPICGSTNIEHVRGEHISKMRGTVRNVPQTICHNCGEIFLGPDSLEIIRSHEHKAQGIQHEHRKPNLIHT